MGDARSDWFDREIHGLLQLESDVETVLASTHVGEYGPAAAELSGLAALPAQHRAALLDYLGRRHSPDRTEAGGAELAAGNHTSRNRAHVLRHLFTVLSSAVIGYAALFEAALRLYDERLREIAPRHHGDYAAAMFTVADLLAPAVAAELADRGLECHCVCPMCSLGLCGCVAVGRMASTSALLPRDGGSGAAAEFLIQTPRSGSQLARLGVLAGDRLVAIDGNPVAGVPEIQSAIRSHRLGEKLRLLIARDGAQRELEVAHAGDYES